MALIVVNAGTNLDSFKITRLAFFSRFSTDELVAVDLAGLLPDTSGAYVRTFMLKVNSAAYIDLSRDDTKDGVNSLVTLNLLTADRANEVLENPITDIERPTWSQGRI
jgi:hypothetical protein